MLELIYALTLSTATRTTCETYKSIHAVKERKKKKKKRIRNSRIIYTGATERATFVTYLNIDESKGEHVTKL